MFCRYLKTESEMKPHAAGAAMSIKTPFQQKVDIALVLTLSIIHAAVAVNNRAPIFGGNI